MKIAVTLPGVKAIELPKYDYKKLRKELEKLSEEYKTKSEKLRELRTEIISPHAGFPVIGDPLVGRPVVSEEAPVLWYRSLVHLGIRGYLRKTLGDVVDEYLYRAGKEVGINLVKEGLIEKKANNDEQVKEIHEKIKALKIGILSVLEFKEDYAQIRVDECISCAGIANVGESVCYWEGGTIVGILSVLFETEVGAAEYKCWGNGDQACEFDVFIGADASKKTDDRKKEIKAMQERGEKEIKGLGIET